jgi:hypothetical protein
MVHPAVGGDKWLTDNLASHVMPRQAFGVSWATCGVMPGLKSIHSDMSLLNTSRHA